MRSMQSARLAVFSFVLVLPACAQAATPGGSAGTGVPAGAIDPQRLKLASCAIPGTPPPTRCGTFRVPEDRSKPGGRQLELNVVVLGATGTPVAPDAITDFAGGPGQAATEEASFIAAAHSALRAHHDIVLVDARGTGRSAPIQCAELDGLVGVQGFLDSFLPEKGVRACRARQGDRDLSQYRTATIVDDAAELFTALGYQQVDAWGGSYGTQVALELARRHPGMVRTLGLQGVVPPGTRMPITFAADAEKALRATLAACAGTPACAGAFPDLDRDLDRAFARLDREPAKVLLADPDTGEEKPLHLDRRGFAQTLRYMLYVPSMAVLLPATLHAAAGGDFEPAAGTAALFARMLGTSGNGLYLSVTCAEDVPFIPDAEVAEAVRGTFLGDFRIRAQQAACRAWDVPAVDRAQLEPVRSDAPALLVSGERDPVTPADWGEQAARTLPRGVHVVVPGGGHGTEGMVGAECIDHLFDQLVERGDAKGLDVSCVKAMHPPDFVLALPPKPVALTAEQRQSFIGTYVGPAVEITISALGEHLRIAIAGEGSFLALARSPKRLELDGLPSTYALEAAEERDGKVTALQVYGLGAESVVVAHRK